MNVNLIYAQSLNGFIGRNGEIPWYVPEDLARFKELTNGCPVIMGRKTWDSLPEKFRPLPNRENIVITNNEKFDQRKCFASSSPEHALRIARDFDAPAVWIIGGEQIYKMFLPRAQYAYVTIIQQHIPDGDAKAPTILLDQWGEISRERLTSKTGIEYENVILKRERPC